MRVNEVIFRLLRKRDPIYVISHERSGTHFAINNLFRNTYIAPNFRYVGDWLGPYSDDSNRFHHIDTFAADWPRWKKGGGIVKSHTCASLFLARFPKARVIYVMRDPRDTLVSFFHYLNKNELYQTNPQLADQRCGDFSEFLRRPASDYLRLGFFDAPDFNNVVGRWASHVKGWLTVPDVCIVRYEDLKTNYQTTIRRICREVGLISRLTMSPVPMDPRNAILPRKGVVGDWKTHFSKEDEQFLAAELARHGVNVEGNLV